MGSADFCAGPADLFVSNVPCLHMLERPYVDKLQPSVSHMQIIGKSKVAKHIHEQKSFEEKIPGQVHGVVVASRLVEEQFRRSCKVRFEDEVAKHGIKHVGTEGGKGEELKTQEGRIGSGVGGDVNGGLTGSSEEM